MAAQGKRPISEYHGKVAPPAEARLGERWIDVDRATQTLTLYESEQRPRDARVHGSWRSKKPTGTPPGVHRIWVKLRTSDMTNLEDEEARRHDAIERSPGCSFSTRGSVFTARSGMSRLVRCGATAASTFRPETRLTSSIGRIRHFRSDGLPALPTDYDPGTLLRVR